MMMYRAYEIMRYWNSMGFMKNAEMSFPGINIRYVVAPNEALSSMIPLSFDLKEAKRMIKLGIRDAKKVVENSKKSYEELMRSYHKRMGM
jgi:hypothetical protein